MGKREAAAPKKAKQVSKKPTGTKKTKKSGKQGGKIAVILLILLLVLTAGAYALLCNQVDTGRMLDHTYIDGVDVSGMTADEAEAALQGHFDETYRNAAVTVMMDGTGYEVPLWRADHSILRPETGPVLEEALSRGNGPFLTRGYAWLMAQTGEWTGESDIAITNGEALYAAVEATGLFDVDTRVETAYTVGETSISIQKGEAGEVADAETTLAAIAALVTEGKWPETDSLDCATVSSEIAALDVQKIYDEIYTEPADATLDRDNDYAIVPSVTGISFDVEAAKTALAEAAPGSAVEVPLVLTEPEITTEKMEQNLFKDVLGSYTTTVSGSSGRRKNVQLSADFCDGTILLVGDVFSYNDVVGERTKARGFSEADAYLNGQTIKQVGGGICQTSSTLYAAVLYSNLEIVTRTNHSFASSYIGLGMDATVSWGGPEFKFANNTKYPIKVVGEYANGKVTMKILGTKTDDITVKIRSKTLETIPFSVKYEDDKTMYVGEEKTITTAYTGYKVQTYRELYDGDGNLISSTEEAYSYYKKRDKVIARGVKEKESDSSDNGGSGEE